MNEQLLQNLFDADHRKAMIKAHGYSEAQFVTVDELNFQYGGWYPEKEEELVF